MILVLPILLLVLLVFLAVRLQHFFSVTTTSTAPMSPYIYTTYNALTRPTPTLQVQVTSRVVPDLLSL